MTYGDELLHELDQVRNRTRAAHRRDPDRNPPWPTDVPTTTATVPVTDAEWEGRARMAQARLDAGQPLDAVDARALARCPNPPKVGSAAYRNIPTTTQEQAA